MIYKCKNCGRNFNLKPDYCDCGNNTFVEVVENFDYSTVQTDFNAEKDVNFLYNNQSSFVEQDEQTSSYDNDLKKQRTSEIIAVVVFVVVLVTALIMIFSNVSALFKKSGEKAPSVEIESYIPADVNEFWTNPAKDSEKRQIAMNNTATNSVNTNSVNMRTANKSSDIIIEKSNQSSINKKADAKIHDKKNTNVKTQEKQNKSSAKKEKTQIVSKDEVKVASSTQNVKKAESIAKNTISVEEYLRYKNSLRSKLFANFPILTVQGQGSAKVAFSLSSEGKLTNRRFVSQSGNKSLDDAMYHMLMRVPAYFPPPEGYDGREIVMQMDFDNGHYSFAYLN